MKENNQVAKYIINRIKDYKFQIYSADNVLRDGQMIMSHISRKEHLIDMYDLNKMLDKLLLELGDNCCSKCGVQVEDTQTMIPCDNCACHLTNKTGWKEVDDIGY